jgi:tRNA threonylcarbamoyladenosine biosynthesis protein TsaB
MKILAVDTCLGACSAAILDGEKTLAHRFELMDRGHAEALAPMVHDAMNEASIAYDLLDRLAVTVGPGTFTGQRVGLAFMRGMRIALKKPLIGVTSLETIAAQASSETKNSFAAALHDARRDEVYVEVLKDGAQLVAPEVLKFDDAMIMLCDLASGEQMVLCGTAAPRAAEVLHGGNLSDVRQPDALWTARLATIRPATDTAPRPLYLRAPDAKLPGQA